MSVGGIGNAGSVQQILALRHCRSGLAIAGAGR